ncbi:MAG: hypothetical protein ACM3NV_07285 [Syntrophothermus sp.]
MWARHSIPRSYLPQLGAARRVAERRPATTPLRVRALGLLVEIEDLLRSPAPVYCVGMALDWELVSDGRGTLYAPRRAGVLCQRPETIGAALRGVREP